MTDEYVAGLFDGEGCIHVHEGMQHGVRTVCATLEIANTHEGLMRLLVEQYGGSYLLQKRGSRIGKHKCWLWRLTGKKAEEFARLILPHTILKREQLELFLALRETIWMRGRSPVPDETWDLRRSLLARIKSAKRTHLVPYV